MQKCVNILHKMSSHQYNLFQSDHKSDNTTPVGQEEEYRGRNTSVVRDRDNSNSTIPDGEDITAPNIHCIHHFL